MFKLELDRFGGLWINLGAICPAVYDEDTRHYKATKPNGSVVFVDCAECAF
jgi:hypothetical protein